MRVRYVLKDISTNGLVLKAKESSRLCLEKLCVVPAIPCVNGVTDMDSMRMCVRSARGLVRINNVFKSVAVTTLLIRNGRNVFHVPENAEVVLDPALLNARPVRTTRFTSMVDTPQIQKPRLSTVQNRVLAPIRTRTSQRTQRVYPEIRFVLLNHP
jgi:hypothetical protein